VNSSSMTTTGRFREVWDSSYDGRRCSTLSSSTPALADVLRQATWLRRTEGTAVGKKEDPKPTQTQKAESRSTQTQKAENRKVENPVVERGGYSSSGRTASELPAPPAAVTRRVTNGDRGASTGRTSAPNTSKEPSTGASAQDGSSAE
jgi:hypothetical protein